MRFGPLSGPGSGVDMRISHTELETCLGNPPNWYVAVRTASSHGYKMGYERSLRLTIFHYHKTSAAEARQYLDKMVKKHNFKNAARVTEIENGLESYIHWAESESLKVADTRIKITLPVGFLELRGEVGRVDVTAAGYRAVLLSQPPPDWQQQLRMPLIQAAIGAMYGRPPDKIAVGFQELDGSNLETVVYGRRQISAAEQRFRLLGETVRRLSKPRRKV
jgi:hypothetical protein